MFNEVVAAFTLLAACVVIHATGLGWLLRRMQLQEFASKGALGISWMLIRLASGLVTLHLLQIAVWAIYFYCQGCLPNLETAFYFSGTTYATVGYGDIVLPHGWRLLGPMEGLTGILMCGLSTGFFFVVVNRIYQAMQSRDAEMRRPP